MTVPELSSSELRGLFPAGTVMHNPVTGEYARVAEHTAERAVGELLAVPGGVSVTRARRSLSPAFHQSWITPGATVTASPAPSSPRWSPSR